MNQSVSPGVRPAPVIVTDCRSSSGPGVSMVRVGPVVAAWAGEPGTSIAKVSAANATPVITLRMSDPPPRPAPLPTAIMRAAGARRTGHCCPRAPSRLPLSGAPFPLSGRWWGRASSRGAPRLSSLPTTSAPSSLKCEPSTRSSTPSTTCVHLPCGQTNGSRSTTRTRPSAVGAALPVEGLDPPHAALLLESGQWRLRARHRVGHAQDDEAGSLRGEQRGLVADLLREHGVAVLRADRDVLALERAVDRVPRREPQHEIGLRVGGHDRAQRRRDLAVARARPVEGAAVALEGDTAEHRAAGNRGDVEGDAVGRERVVEARAERERERVAHEDDVAWGCRACGGARVVLDVLLGVGFARRYAGPSVAPAVVTSNPTRPAASPAGAHIHARRVRRPWRIGRSTQQVGRAGRGERDGRAGARAGRRPTARCGPRSCTR